MNHTVNRDQKLQRVAVHAGGGLLALLVLGLTYFYFYAPMRDEIVDRAGRIDRVRQLTSHGEAITREYARMVERLKQLTKAAAKTRKRMPLALSSSAFIDQTTRLAGELNLTVEQSQTGPPQIHDDHATVEVSYRLLGSYSSICQYLAAIDQLPQIARVWRLDVTRNADSEAYPVQVTFQLYYQVDPHDKDKQQGTL